MALSLWVFVPASAQADAQQQLAAMLASMPVSGPTCGAPALSQPFASFNDFSFYTPAPGQSTAGFTGKGWTLAGGATVTPAAQATGGTGRVLQLTGGSVALSPAMCVDRTYPTARLMVRNVIGGGSVHVFVSYASAQGWGKPRDGGAAHGEDNAWGLSDDIHVQPNHQPGWQWVRFAFVPDGASNALQVYDFYVDPYAKG